MHLEQSKIIHPYRSKSDERDHQMVLKNKSTFQVDINIKIFIWLSCIDCLTIPKSNISIWTCADKPIFYKFYKLYFSFMAWCILINWNYWFLIKFPSQTNNLPYYEELITLLSKKLCKWNNIRNLKLTKFSNISL